MPPRKSNGSIKRARSISSSLSPDPVISSAKKAAKANGKPSVNGNGTSEEAVKVEATTNGIKEENATPKRKPRKSASKPAIIESPEASEEDVKPIKKPRVNKAKAKAPKLDANEADANGVPEEGEAKEAKPKKAPKAKAFPPPDLDPSTFPPRSGHPPFPLPQLTAPPNGSLLPPGTRPMLLGAHVSVGGGPATALLRAGKAGANGLAMFVKNQRSWKSNPYEPEAIERFHTYLKPISEGGLGYPAEAVLVHGSYLINLGNPDQAKWDMSYECFRDDLQRCHQLGIKLYNWHPGSTVGACTKEESFALIAKAINQAHKEVPEVICVIENMANANSNIIGTKFYDLASIIALVEDKSRVRICLDTCHLFAAGYDIRTPEAYNQVMDEFNEVVGNKYLGGIHMNDSKADLGGCKDLHENIGLGKIGLTGFRQLMRDPRMANIPLILETPAPEKPLEVNPLSIWTREIQLLYEIQGIEDEEWKVKESEITDRWRKERDELNPPKEKVPKKAKGKGKKGKDADEDDEDDED